MDYCALHMNNKRHIQVFVRLATLLFVFVVFGTSWFLLVERPGPTLHLLGVFPKDSLLVVEWDHAGKNWQRWRKNWPESREILSNSFHLFDKQELLFPFFKEIDSLIAQYDAVADLPFMHLLTNVPVALAVLPGNDHQDLPPKFLLEQSVLAVQTGTAVSMQKHPDFSNWLKLETTSLFQGEIIEHLKMPNGEEIVCWQRSDVLLYAKNASLLHQCIQLYLQQKIRHYPTFLDNPAVQPLKVHDAFPVDVFCYLDLTRLQKNVPWIGHLVHKFDVLQLQQVALYQHTRDQITKLGGIATINRGAGTAVDVLYHLPQPQGPLPVDVSSSTSLLFWTNWFDFKRLWKFIVQTAPVEISSFFSVMELSVPEQTGLAIDNFFDLFGQRFGIFMDAHQISYQADRSLGCLSIEIKDRDKVERLIRRLTKDLQVISIQSGKTEVYTVMLAGGLLQPAYMLEKNRLIIADNAGLIDQAQHYFVLDEHHDYQDLLGFQRDRGNIFLFTRPDGLIERFLPLLSMAARENRDPKRMFSPETRLKLRRYVIPLLTALQQYATFSLSGSVTSSSVSVGVDFSLKPVQKVTGK